MNVKVPQEPTLEFIMELEDVLFQATIDRCKVKQIYPSEELAPLTARVVYNHIISRRGGLK